MHLPATLLAVLAATSLAKPIVRRGTDTVVVLEEIFVYPDNEVVSTAYVTSTSTSAAIQPTSVATTSAVVQTPTVVSTPVVQATSSVVSSAATATASGGSFLQNGGSSSSSSSSGASATLSKVESLSNSVANTDVVTKTGYVEWSADADSLFARMSIYHHNVHRLNHTVGELVWDSDLANDAQAWANKCVMEEILPDGKSYGMNAAWSSSEDFNPSDFISNAWYGEINNYPWADGANVPTTPEAVFNTYGHFSQVVWDETSKVGCGIATNCGGDFTSHAACYYTTPGNYAGQFDSVKAAIGAKPVYSNSDS